jgi:hypothetical protein
MRRRSRSRVVPAALAWIVGTSAVAQVPIATPAIAAPVPAEAREPAGPPAGSGARSVIVPPPTIKGEAPEHIAGALQQGVRDGLTDAGVEVGEAPQGCADATCAAKAVSSGQARAYVSAEVRITGSDYVLSADILDGNGKSLARKEGSCEICTYEEAAVALRELVAAAARELAPVEPEPSVTAPAPVIEPEPAPAKPPRKRLSPQTTQIIAFTAIGVGVAALVGGIVLLVLDENPVKSNCSGVHVDADGDCEFRHDTLGGGIALTVTGVAVAGGGVGLLLWQRKQAKRGPSEVSLVPWGLRARF